MRPTPSILPSSASTSAATRSRICRNSSASSAPTSNLTVFRKLKHLGYLASYTHRGRFYTLTEIARFDDHGLWSHEACGSPAMVRCWPPWKPS